MIASTDCAGTLANSMCRSITFHISPQNAQKHLDNHPELHAVIIGQTDAIALADYAFRSLLPRD